MECFKWGGQRRCLVGMTTGKEDVEEAVTGEGVRCEGVIREGVRGGCEGVIPLLWSCSQSHSLSFRLAEYQP